MESAAASDQTLCCNQVKNQGSSLSTGSGEHLEVQADGNVVLYIDYLNPTARWSTNTSGSGIQLKAQSDGNVVVYQNGTPRWASRSDIYAGAYLRLQDSDGNLVVYSGSTPVWAMSWAKSAAGAKTYAQRQFFRYGWSISSQFSCLDSLWQHESGWSWSVQNPNSSAYGIPQALNPASRMGNIGQMGGSNWHDDGQTQVSWGLWYIRNNGNFSTPCGAWSFWQSHGWY
jgi:hypothetical protein